MKYKRVKTAGIYAIHVGDIAYIGMSKDVSRRFASHCYGLRHNRHPQKELQKAYNEGNKLSLRRLEECYPSEVKDLEKRWIQLYRTKTQYKTVNIFPKNIP
jgi:predicted GIY-YIG superfamily endonuclease